MALVMFFASLCPASASRPGNYGEYETWEMSGLGALTMFVTALCPPLAILGSLAGYYVYSYHYESSGETVMSFDIFGTEVNLTRQSVWSAAVTLIITIVVSIVLLFTPAAPAAPAVLAGGAAFVGIEAAVITPVQTIIRIIVEAIKAVIKAIMDVLKWIMKNIIEVILYPLKAFGQAVFNRAVEILIIILQQTLTTFLGMIISQWWTNYLHEKHGWKKLWAQSATSIVRLVLIIVDKAIESLGKMVSDKATPEIDRGGEKEPAPISIGSPRPSIKNPFLAIIGLCFGIGLDTMLKKFFASVVSDLLSGPAISEKEILVVNEKGQGKIVNKDEPISKGFKIDERGTDIGRSLVLPQKMFFTNSGTLISQDQADALQNKWNTEAAQKKEASGTGAEKKGIIDRIIDKFKETGKNLSKESIGRQVLAAFLGLPGILGAKGDLDQLFYGVARDPQGRPLQGLSFSDAVLGEMRSRGYAGAISTLVSTGMLDLLDKNMDKDYSGRDRKKAYSEVWKKIVAQAAGQIAASAASEWNSLGSWYAGTTDNPYSRRGNEGYWSYVGLNTLKTAAGAGAEVGLTRWTRDWHLHPTLKGVVHLAGGVAASAIGDAAFRRGDKSNLTPGNFAVSLGDSFNNHFIQAALDTALTPFPMGASGTELDSWSAWEKNTAKLKDHITLMANGYGPIMATAVRLGPNLTSQAGAAVGNSFGYSIANLWLPSKSLVEFKPTAEVIADEAKLKENESSEMKELNKVDEIRSGLLELDIATKQLEEAEEKLKSEVTAETKEMYNAAEDEVKNVMEQLSPEEKAFANYTLRQEARGEALAINAKGQGMIVKRDEPLDKGFKIDEKGSQLLWSEEVLRNMPVEVVAESIVKGAPAAKENIAENISRLDSEISTLKTAGTVAKYTSWIPFVGAGTKLATGIASGFAEKGWADLPDIISGGIVEYQAITDPKSGNITYKRSVAGMYQPLETYDSQGKLLDRTTVNRFGWKKETSYYDDSGAPMDKKTTYSYGPFGLANAVTVDYSEIALPEKWETVVTPERKETQVVTSAQTEMIGVFFDFDKNKIRDDQEENVEKIHQWLQKNPEKKITIIGRADPIGTDPYNEKLGERRAKAVKSWLVKNGIEASRIDTKSIGESNPKTSVTHSEIIRGLDRKVYASIEIPAVTKEVTAPAKTRPQTYSLGPNIDVTSYNYEIGSGSSPYAGPSSYEVAREHNSGLGADISYAQELRSYEVNRPEEKNMLAPSKQAKDELTSGAGVIYRANGASIKYDVQRDGLMENVLKNMEKQSQVEAAVSVLAIVPPAVTKKAQ